MHHLGSKLVDCFVLSIAVFAVHITEAFSLQILPLNRYKVAIKYSLGYLRLSINIIIICKHRSGQGLHFYPNVVSC